MKSTTLSRNLGKIGVAGALLWILTLVLEYSLGLQPPAGEGPLYVLNQILALTALVGIALGYQGIKAYRGVSTRFGRISVSLFTVGYFLIVIAGVFALIMRSDDSPIFILFPLGGLLMDLGALFTGFSVMKANVWQGWRRFMPLIYAIYLWAVIEIPFILEFYPDGPGFVPEIFQALGLLMVGVATFQESDRNVEEA